MIYPVLPHGIIAELEKDFDFYAKGYYRNDTHAAIRLLTSWAMDEKPVDIFLSQLERLSQS